MEVHDYVGVRLNEGDELLLLLKDLLEISEVIGRVFLLFELLYQLYL